MLDTPTQQQRQVWVAQRLYRICSSYRDRSRSEPCLEQYEQQVQLMMGDAVTPAASAWIEIIVQCLRTETHFAAEVYLPSI